MKVELKRVAAGARTWVLIATVYIPSSAWSAVEARCVYKKNDDTFTEVFGEQVFLKQVACARCVVRYLWNERMRYRGT